MEAIVDSDNRWRGKATTPAVQDALLDTSKAVAPPR